MLNYTQLHANELNIDFDMATLTAVIHIVCSRSEIDQTVNNNEREILNSKLVANTNTNAPLNRSYIHTSQSCLISNIINRRAMHTD